MGWTPRTLKGQLTALFLVFTLVPSILIAAAATRQLLEAVAAWESPGVQNALEGGHRLAAELMARARNDLRQRGQILAADPDLAPPIDPATLFERTQGLNLDFVQIYSDTGVLLAETTRDPQMTGKGPIPGVDSIATSPLSFWEDPDQDVVAYVGYAGEPGGAEWIVVAGMDLDTGFYGRLGALNTGYTFYQRLPEVIRLRQIVALITMGLIVLVMAGGSAWIARRLATRVSQPVAALGEGMARVTRGEEGVQVTPRGPEETERLIGTFNTMSQELSRSRRALARAERLSAWRDVARRVAHEMKNALTPIVFSTHRLRKSAEGMDPAEADRVRQALDTVNEEVEGLRRLAASFSELARLPVPEMERFDLKAMVEAAVQAVPEEAGRLTVDLPGGPVPVLGDRTLLRQAVGNVVKNAIEATAATDRIWIRLEAGDREVRLVVEDAGAGWPEGKRERSLDPYVTTKETGTGLGLSLVQRTLLQHGGTVELGDRPGGGARVTLILPREAVPEQEGS